MTKQDNHTLSQSIEKVVTQFVTEADELQMTIDNINYMGQSFMSSQDFHEMPENDRSDLMGDFNRIIKLLNQLNLVFKIDKIAKEKGVCHAA